MALNLSAASGALKRHYEKIILVVVLLGLIVSGLLVFFRVQELVPEASSRRAPVEKAAQGVDTNLFARLDQVVNSPVQQRLGDFDLLVGPRTRWHRGAPLFIDVRMEGDDDGDGMLSEWEKRNRLDPLDPADAYLDPDNDGYINLEEFLSGTDPWDPASQPPPAVKLRMVGRPRYRPIELRLQTVMPNPRGEGQVFQVNLGGRTEFHQIGDKVGDYVIEAYEEQPVKVPDPATGQETTRNVQVLRVRKGEQVIELVARRPHIESVPEVLLARLEGARVSSFRRMLPVGAAFDVAGKNYKIVDIQESHVRLQDVGTGQEFSVPRLSQEEVDRLRAGGQRNPAAAATRGPATTP